MLGTWSSAMCIIRPKFKSSSSASCATRGSTPPPITRLVPSRSRRSPIRFMKKPKKPKLAKAAAPLKGARNLAGKGFARVPLKRAGRTTEEKVSDALAGVPRITNETVGEHREEVLSSARKYIYPLQHSKNRVVKISLWLFAGVIIAFFAVTGLELYKIQATGGFFYDVTRIIPLPAAKTGGNWISYESYLFELKRNMHYYQTQQQATFKGRDGRAQLARLKQQAMAQVVQDAYVKQL